MIEDAKSIRWSQAFMKEVSVILDNLPPEIDLDSYTNVCIGDTLVEAINEGLYEGKEPVEMAHEFADAIGIVPRTVYIDIDVKPNPDCYPEDSIVFYVLYPPSDEPWSLEWENEDDIYSENLMRRVFGAERLMEGCTAIYEPLPENLEELCTENNIIINRIGEDLDENC